MRIAIYALLPALVGAAIARADDEFEKAPIQYSTSEPDNIVSRLQKRLDQSEAKLEFDESHGYLPALLRAFQIPVESQMLVFSKTSMQRDRIAPESPRAIYFNDDVYVGFCRAGAVLEVSVADPALGAVFYTIKQEKAKRPALRRQTESCLQCHSTGRGDGIPGHLVRSVFTDSSGQPILSEGSFRVDQTTPLSDRWGGWYVTGTHGAQKHLGNLLVKETSPRHPIANDKGLNVTQLNDRLPVAEYLSPHSDIVALMVFEHQTMVQNLITRATFSTRQALHYQKELNRELGEPADHQWESTDRRISSAGDDLVKALLFANEAPLTAPIVGTSEFARTFPLRGKRDPNGRSLRDFDLKTRLFKYPCSYLIESAAFDGLPPEIKDYVAARLRLILTGSGDAQKKRPDDEKTFHHLSAEDRGAIWEIISDTKPALFSQNQ